MCAEHRAPPSRRAFLERSALKRSANQEKQLWAARFAQQVGKLELADLSRSHVRTHIRKIGEGGAPIYANRAQALIRQIGNFGVAIICLTFVVRALMFPIAMAKAANERIHAWLAERLA